MQTVKCSRYVCIFHSIQTSSPNFPSQRKAEKETTLNNKGCHDSWHVHCSEHRARRSMYIHFKFMHWQKFDVAHKSIILICLHSASVSPSNSTPKRQIIWHQLSSLHVYMCMNHFLSFSFYSKKLFMFLCFSCIKL